MGTNEPDPNAGGGSSNQETSQATQAIDEAQKRDQGGSREVSGGPA